MSIKAGELIHVGNSILIDRAQTGGVSALNQPTDRIYELGDYRSVGTIRDIPDLTFGLESFDVSASLEALLQDQDASAAADGTVFDIGASLYVDVVGQFKRGRTQANPFDVAGSIVLPFLALEQLSYNFGLHSNASQTASLRGDSIFWAEGSAFVQSVAGTAAAGQAIVLTHHAVPYKGDFVAGTRYALSVELVKSGQRLVLGRDYTEAGVGVDPAAVVTVTIIKSVPTTEMIRVCYQSVDTVANYPQNSNAPASTTKPAAIRGKDITILLGPQGTPLDPDANKLSGVQQFTADWRVQLQKDEELGSSQAIGADYDVPDVTGQVDFKPINFHDFMERVRTLAGLASGTQESVGPYQVVPLQMAAILHSPYDGTVLKTIYIPDARFTLPTFQGRVQTKATAQIPYTSDGGVMQVSKGLFPFA